MSTTFNTFRTTLAQAEEIAEFPDSHSYPQEEISRIFLILQEYRLKLKEQGNAELLEWLDDRIHDLSRATITRETNPTAAITASLQATFKSINSTLVRLQNIQDVLQLEVEAKPVDDKDQTLQILEFENGLRQLLLWAETVLLPTKSTETNQ